MRAIDENKIAQVEQATAEFVVENGYGGASVEKIAKHAGVSKGYLYRFYTNKQELVQSLLTRYINLIVDEIENSLSTNTSTDRVLSDLIHHIFSIAKETPTYIKFIYVLMHDYNFQLHEEQRQKIRSVLKQFYNRGVTQNIINEKVIPEEIFTIAVIYPIDFINLRYKGFFKQSDWNQDDISRVITFCTMALKN